MLRKVTELGSNEAIHCPTESEAIAICKLMHEAGLKWEDGTDYGKYDTEYDTYGSKTSYLPNKGDYNDVGYYTRIGYTIYPATDFLPQIEDTPQQYTITREQAKELCELEPTNENWIITELLNAQPFSNIINVQKETVLEWHRYLAHKPDTIEWLNANGLSKPKQKVEVVRYALIDKDGDISSIERTEERAIEFSQGNYEIVKLSGSYEI